MHEMPKYCFRVLSKLAKPCPVRKNATPRAGPTTVLLDPSTKEEPWKAKERMSHPLHWKCTFIVPPRPVDSTLVTNNIPINIEIENACDGRFKIFFSKCKFIVFDNEKYGDKNMLTGFQTFQFSNEFIDINYKTENMHKKTTKY